jgi:hypothetical protein
MLTAVLQSLIAPRNFRRYVGRHRERVAPNGFSVGVDAAVIIAPTPRPVDRESSAEAAGMT